MSAVSAGLRLKSVLLPLLLTLAALGAAQGRWQLGNPSLIIDMPADPSSGGVAWHDRGALSVFPTSWSAESGDLRVEVAESYSSDTAQAHASSIAAKLSAPLSASREVTVSGFPALRFQAGNKHGLVVAAAGRAWAVVVTPKTSAGMGQMESTFASVVLERWGSPRWVRRSFGSTKMNAELPYEMAAQPRQGSNSTQDYELHFDDFNVEAWVSQAGEGKTINYEGTIKSYIDSEKSKAGTKDFKSSREKLKRDKLQGDIITVEFKRGTKDYRIRSFFGMDEGRLLRISAVARPTNAAHETYAQRIMNSLQVASVNFAGYAPRRVPGEDVWFDLPKDFEPPKQDAGSKVTGVLHGFAIDVRVTPTAAGLRNDGVQLLDMLEIKHKARVPSDAKDVRIDKSGQMVDGVQTRLLKLRYKGKGRSDDTVIYALAMMLPDRIVVAEMIAEDQQSAYLDRIVETAKIELSPPSGWTRQAAGEAGFSIFSPTRLEANKVGPDNTAQIGNVAYEIQAEGVVAIVIEAKYKDLPPPTPLLLRERFEGIKKSFGVTGKIAAQQPIEVANASGLKVLLEMELAGGRTRDMDLIVLKRGNYVWTMIVFSDPGAEAKRMTVVNSIR